MIDMLLLSYSRRLVGLVMSQVLSPLPHSKRVCTCGSAMSPWSLPPPPLLRATLNPGPYYPHQFVFLLCKQIARTAVSIGFARGSMLEAVAIDHNNIARRDFAKIGDYEPWQSPY